jgi:hypothetical protein
MGELICHRDVRRDTTRFLLGDFTQTDTSRVSCG